jgi:hypothetical protein
MLLDPIKAVPVSCGAAGWLSILKVREQIRLHVKAAAGGFENAHFSAMCLKKHEKA